MAFSVFLIASRLFSASLIFIIYFFFIQHAYWISFSVSCLWGKCLSVRGLNLFNYFLITVSSILEIWIVFTVGLLGYLAFEKRLWGFNSQDHTSTIKFKLIHVFFLLLLFKNPGLILRWLFTLWGTNLIYRGIHNCGTCLGCLGPTYTETGFSRILEKNVKYSAEK